MVRRRTLTMFFQTSTETGQLGGFSPVTLCVKNKAPLLPSERNPRDRRPRLQTSGHYCSGRTLLTHLRLDINGLVVGRVGLPPVVGLQLTRDVETLDVFPPTSPPLDHHRLERRYVTLDAD
jgi:hypothetical protein